MGSLSGAFVSLTPTLRLPRVRRAPTKKIGTADYYLETGQNVLTVPRDQSWIVQGQGDLAQLYDGRQARPVYYDLGRFFKLPPKLKCATLHVKPPSRTHTAAPHCGSHCHKLRVLLTPQFLWRQPRVAKVVVLRGATLVLRGVRISSGGPGVVVRPAQSPLRDSVCAACTLNAAGQSRVTPSLR